jgi:hypothetical protein
MTLAPRVEVFTQLSCHVSQHHHYNHTVNPVIPQYAQINPYTPLYFSLDPLGPTFIPYLNDSRIVVQHHKQDQDQKENDDQNKEDPRVFPSNKCLSNPVVQAGAARLQTIMTITMGGLSALTTGWWGQFGERYGRTRILAVATLGLFLTYVPELTLAPIQATDTIFEVISSSSSSPYPTHRWPSMAINYSSLRRSSKVFSAGFQRCSARHLLTSMTAPLPAHVLAYSRGSLASFT